jgi:hypothetical protein
MQFYTWQIYKFGSIKSVQKFVFYDWSVLFGSFGKFY